MLCILLKLPHGHFIYFSSYDSMQRFVKGIIHHCKLMLQMFLFHDNSALNATDMIFVVILSHLYGNNNDHNNNINNNKKMKRKKIV